MARQHGIAATTYDNLVIDSGAAYTGWTDMSTLGTLMGATKGGNTFNLEQEIKKVEIDGARGPAKGGRRITDVTATLVINFIEQTLANWVRLVVGSSSAVHAVNWDEITRALAIGASDYLSNVALIGEVSGATGACGIVLTEALVDSNFEMSLEDKEESVIAATFTAHFDPADWAAGTDTEPWSLIYPNT